MNNEFTKFKSLFEYYGFTKADEKKSPVISGILKELTPETIEREIRKVAAVELPPELQKWVDEYERIGGGWRRRDFIWKWTYLRMDGVTLDSVTSEYRESVLIAKVASTILNVLVDDIADRRKDGQMLERASSIVYSFPEHVGRAALGAGEGESELGLIARIWGFLNDTIRSYPRHNEFEEVFLYDYRQFLNAAAYARLVNRNLHMMNMPEYEIYLSPNMQGMVLVTIDLMASPDFGLKELGTDQRTVLEGTKNGQNRKLNKHL